MKLFNVVGSMALLITAALAQVVIESPPDGSSVAAGSELVVNIGRPVRFF
jgi:hypothetical protein